MFIFIFKLNQTYALVSAHSCYETKITDGDNAGIVSHPCVFACLLAKIIGHTIVAEPPRQENQPVQD
jgi:hypothetical protein